MLRTLDRYVLREVIPPFLISLVVFTFVLEIPPIIQQGEQLIAKGASWGIVSRILLTLLPQALGITIPIALLMGILIALGRLSGDRETVALGACGVSLARLLRPIGLLAVAAMAATLYVMIVAVPAANQAFRELTFRIVSTRAESEVKPRVFFDDFPNLVLYVRDVTVGVGWKDVMVADSSAAEDPKLYLAERGRMVIDAERRTVDMVLEDGAMHSVNLRQPDQYRVTEFRQTIVSLNPDAVIPRQGPLKGDREMTIAELRERITDLERQGVSPHNQIIAIQQKFSIPVACLVFALIALGLGVTTRRDGKLASFVLGIGVVFAYYILMYMGQSMARGALIPAWSAMWLPDIVLGLWGVLLLVWKVRYVERPLRFGFPSIHHVAKLWGVSVARRAGPRRRWSILPSLRMTALPIPRPTILDWYVTKQAVRASLLAACSLLSLFYISTFIDLSDKLFKGTTTAGTILHFMWFATPQFTYYVIPLAVLIGTLVTVGGLTKNAELIVMKACGISLYRAAAPLVLLAAVGSAMLFGLEERVLADANRRADAINDVIRERAPRTSDVVNRRWVVARDGDMYNYVYFDNQRNVLNGLNIYEFGAEQKLTKRTYVSQAVFTDAAPGSTDRVAWQGRQGWEWQLAPRPQYTAFANHGLMLESPTYFGSERPNAEQMTYSRLREHIGELRASGFNIVPYVVALHRKLAFPFITIIMALIAVPFAVTTGNRGALYGIGVGIVLGILYWTAISVFAAIGSGGLMAPALAAWAPNAIFGCAAIYLLLTVRT